MISKIDLLILGLLAEKPMHGYEINQVLTSGDMRLWVDVGRTSIYYALTRLEKKGLVVQIIEKQLGKPEKSVYHITNKGREIFLSALSESLAEQEKIQLEYNIGLFFMNKLSRDKVVGSLKKRENFLNNWLTSLDNSIDQKHQQEVYLSTSEVVLKHTRVIIQREIDWLNDLLQEMEKTDKIERLGKPKIGLISPAEKQSWMAIQGNIKNSILLDVLHMIRISALTGTLALKKGAHVCSLSFRKGRPIYAVSAVQQPSSNPGMRIVHGGQGNKSLGDKKDQVGKVYEKRVLDDVLDTFLWSEGTYVFQPDEIIETGGIPLNTTVESLILQGCRKVDNWEKIRRAVPSNAVAFDIESDFKDEILEPELTKKEREILSYINGIKDVESLAHICHLSIFDVSKILYCFVALGLLKIASLEKREAFGLYRNLAKALFDGLKPVAGRNKIKKIEEKINAQSEQEGIPIFIESGNLTEKVKSSIELSQFVKMLKSHFQILIDIFTKHAGSSFVSQLYESTLKKLAPELMEIYTRYGFEEVQTGVT